MNRSGEIYVAGYTGGSLGQPSAGGDDIFLRKYASDGSVIWTKQYGGSGGDDAYGVAVDTAGEAYVVGETTGALPGQVNLGRIEAFLLKYDNSGNQMWIRQFGTSQFDFATGVAVDAFGAAYVTGVTYGTLPGQTSTGRADAFVRKYDDQGAIVWTRQFGGSSMDYAEGVTVAPSGAVYVAGYTLGSLPGQTSAGNYDAFVAQFRVAGPDPAVNETANQLTITGTPGDDLIVLDPGTQPESVQVTINGTLLGVFSGLTDISVLGGGGDDTIVVNTLAGANVFLDGQQGSNNYVINLAELSGSLTIADSGGSGQNHLTVNATEYDDYIEKQADLIQWWYRDFSPLSDPGDAPPPLASINFTGIDQTTIWLGGGNDYIVDPGGNTEILGGPGDDTYVITASSAGGVQIQDQDGANQVLVYLGALAGPVTVDSTLSFGTTQVTVIGTDSADTITVTPAGITTGTGEVVNLVGQINGLSIDPGAGGQVVLDDLGSSPTQYDVFSPDGTTPDVQITGSPPPFMTINELPLPQLSGRVFADANNDGLVNGDDSGLANITLQLFSENDLVDPVATTTTDQDGYYSFANILPGTYRVMEQQPAGYLDGRKTAGTLGGTVDNSEDSNSIIDIVLAAGNVGTDYDFAEILPSRIQGLVWEDFNNDGEIDFGEKAIEAAIVALTGVDDRGSAVSLTMATDAQGIVEFSDLRPGNYTLTETQPDGYPDGKDTLGTVNGVITGDASVNDHFSQVVLPTPGSDGVDYNFGERSPTGGAVSSGQTASIGFWQNKNGQALILSLNGGPTSTQLGDWLAATFPNMYGALEGMTNQQVADLYTSLFKRTAKTSPGGPPKLDAQVLATALAVYVTNETLAATAAAGYGFHVTADGVGTSIFNIGPNGAAFGVADNTQLTVLDILLATDARTKNGLLYDLDGSGTISKSEQDLRTEANDVYSAINDAGGF